MRVTSKLNQFSMVLTKWVGRRDWKAGQLPDRRQVVGTQKSTFEKTLLLDMRVTSKLNQFSMVLSKWIGSRDWKAGQLPARGRDVGTQNSTPLKRFHCLI
jgi:hypothetical protein